MSMQNNVYMSMYMWYISSIGIMFHEKGAMFSAWGVSTTHDIIMC